MKSHLWKSIIVASVLFLPACASIPGLSSIPGISALTRAPSVSGEWLVTRPKSSFSWTIFENGDKISGSSDSSPITGSRSGSNKVHIEIYLSYYQHNVSYDGEISSDGKTISGIIGNDVTDTFIANKKN